MGMPRMSSKNTAVRPGTLYTYLETAPLVLGMFFDENYNRAEVYYQLSQEYVGRALMALENDVRIQKDQLLEL